MANDTSDSPGPAPASQSPAWWRRPVTLGPLDTLLTGRAFIPVSLALALTFLASTGLLVATRTGWVPPTLWRATPHTIVITGPGVDQSADTITAYILGAVQTPGVYTLPPGARVGDLVQAAGGLLSGADPTRVDLAAHVADGQEIYVPRIGEVVPADLNGLVNLNTASAAELHDALGISLDLARRIVAYRAAHGPFTAVSQLLLVPISRSVYDRIRYLVTV